MKQGSTLFLKLVVVLIGGVVLAVCAFGLPYALMTDNTGMYAPILYGLYIPAIPFFVAIYQALQLLTYIDHNKVFSESSVHAVSKIKYSAIAISILFTVGSPYIYMVAEKDDAPGVIALALVFIFASSVIATAAAVLQKLLQNVVEIKSENDLTV